MAAGDADAAWSPEPAGGWGGAEDFAELGTSPEDYGGDSLDDDAFFASLRDAVRDLLSKGQKHILLNLGDVTYIDSSGIGELVSAFTTVKNQGGELKLLNLTRKVHDLLQITKLFTVFDIYTDETTAVNSFR